MGNLDDVKEKIVELSRNQLEVNAKDVFKETQRQLLHIFSNIYYTDGNNKLIRVKCIPAQVERSSAKQFKDSGLVLPLISISEDGVDLTFKRGRYSGNLAQYKYFDPVKLRNVRIISLPPRPITIKFGINIWTQYKEDLDSIRANVYNHFNPDMQIQTLKSDITKAFITSEDDASVWNADDGEDRLLRKTVNITVETWVESPKFKYTSSAQIERFEVDLKFTDENGNIIQNMPIETKNT